MVAKYSPPGDGRAAPALPSERARPAPAGGARQPAGQGWPRQARLLRRSEFEQVYAAGRRYSSPFFSAFLLKTGAPTSKVGLTASKALGKATRRNRIKRRLREAARLHLPEIAPGWNIVFNPKRAVLNADFAGLEQEVSRLFGWLQGRAPRSATGA